LNPRSDNPKGITFLDQQDNERSGPDTLLSEKDVKQHSDNIEQATTEENRLDSLMKMSRSLAHDLNNLLTTILANTQLASLMLEDEKIQSYLNTVEEATGDAGMVIRKFQESLHALARSPNKRVY